MSLVHGHPTPAAVARLAVVGCVVVTTACWTSSRHKVAPHPTDAVQATARQQRSVDPTGQYNLTFTDDGATRSATMELHGTLGAYTGRINAENRPEVTVTAVAASGPQVIVTGDIPQGVLLLRFRMTGDSLRGDWSLRNDGGRLAGVRRAGAK